MEELHQRQCVTASIFIVKLHVEAVAVALSLWMVVAPCLTVKPNSGWSFND